MAFKRAGAEGQVYFLAFRKKRRGYPRLFDIPITSCLIPESRLQQA